MTDQQLWDRGGCTACKHYVFDKGACPAFPKGIPLAIASGERDHLSHIEGDHGIQFEPRSSEPAAKNYAPLKPASVNKSGRLRFTSDAIRNFASGMIRRLAEKFGHTYEDD